jgi:hypothetical protein
MSSLGKWSIRCYLQFEQRPLAIGSSPQEVLAIRTSTHRNLRLVRIYMISAKRIFGQCRVKDLARRGQGRGRCIGGSDRINRTRRFFQRPAVEKGPIAR